MNNNEFNVQPDLANQVPNNNGENNTIFTEQVVTQPTPTNNIMTTPIQPVEEQKTKKSKGPLIFILILIILGLVGYIVYDKFFTNNTQNNVKIEEKDEVIESKIDKDEALKEATKVYEEMFDAFANANFKYNQTQEYYQTEYADYFTEKGSYEVFNMLNDETGSKLMSSIFNVVDQGKRKLTIQFVDDNTLVATGLFTAEENEYGTGDSDLYPRYIIFKKIDGVWKIDMFE